MQIDAQAFPGPGARAGALVARPASIGEPKRPPEQIEKAPIRPVIHESLPRRSTKSDHDCGRQRQQCRGLKAVVLPQGQELQPQLLGATEIESPHETSIEASAGAGLRKLTATRIAASSTVRMGAA